MDLASRLMKIAVKLEIGNDSVFGYPIDKQKQYIANFPVPKDDVQRSYFQYKCQMKFNKPIITFFVNLASLPLLLLYYFKSGSMLPPGNTQADSIFIANGAPENIIPSVLRNEVGNIEVINEKKELLMKDDKNFIRSLWKRYPFSFHFIVKCLLKVRYYSYEIQRVHPKNIIVCNEYSFTSSVLTKYCENRGIKHINVMHGEKIYYMRDSFFRFHEFYVWDEHYKKLLSQMRAEPNQFKVAIPPSLKFPDYEEIPKTKQYTYYLGWASGDKLRIIVKAMDNLQKHGLRVAIRPHPRYTNLDEIRSIAPGMDIEDFKVLTIEESLKRTEYAVSVYSTVLNQAYHNGIGIVIDDVSDKEKYERLEERQYIMLSKPHELLSVLLEKWK